MPISNIEAVSANSVMISAVRMECAYCAEHCDCYFDNYIAIAAGIYGYLAGAAFY